MLQLNPTLGSRRHLLFRLSCLFNPSGDGRPCGSQLAFAPARDPVSDPWDDIDLSGLLAFTL